MDRVRIELTTNRSANELPAQIVKNTYKFPSLGSKCLCMSRSKCTTTFAHHNQDHKEHTPLGIPFLPCVDGLGRVRCVAADRLSVFCSGHNNEGELSFQESGILFIESQEDL